MANSLKKLRLEKGWTHEQAAERMGLSRGQFIKLERGERQLTERTIDLAAKAFSVDAAAVLADLPTSPTVPLVGYVGAGATAYFFAGDQGELDRVAAPDGAGPSTVAVEIRGDSLGSFFDRWLVFYDDVRRPITPDLIGKLCVVGLPDDRVLIKKVQRSRTRGLFHLLSQFEPPILDVPVEWAAQVKHMVPR